MISNPIIYKLLKDFTNHRKKTNRAVDDEEYGTVTMKTHVAAVLLMLSNYILENGHVVEKTSTSLPCSWNKGKKRNKTPRKLHESMYESSK